MAVVSILATFAMPSIGRMRESAAIQNGRYMVSSALSLARATGVQWGTTSVLRIDTLQDALRVVVDTGSGSWGRDTVVVREYRLSDLGGLALESDRAALCFNSRGIGTPAAQCAGSGALFVLRNGGRTDTVEVTSVGRIRP